MPGVERVRMQEVIKKFHKFTVEGALSLVDSRACKLRFLNGNRGLDSVFT